MKRVMILVALGIIATTSSLLAQHRGGVFLEGGVSRSKYHSAGSGSSAGYLTTDRMVTISPKISFMANEVVEIQPGFNLGFSTYGYSDSLDGEITDHYKFKQTSFGFDIASYFHVLRTEIFHLSVGPKIELGFAGAPDREGMTDGDIEEVSGDEYYDDYSNTTFEIAAPLNCDFHVGKSFGFRIKFNLFAWGINSFDYTLKDSDNNSESSNKYLSILGSTIAIEGDEYPVLNAIPTIGLFWRF